MSTQKPTFRVMKNGYDRFAVDDSIDKYAAEVDELEKNNFEVKDLIRWEKTNPMPRNMNIHFVNSTECWIYFIYNGTSGTFNNNGEVLHDFLESSVCPASEKKHGKHPTQKPLSILNTLITTLTNEGDVVLDPFMGSGSTCLACKELNRRFIGCELDDKYFEVAKSRFC